MMTHNGTGEARPTRVLICEDEIVVSMDIMFMLSDLGYEVVGQCASVAEGMKLLSKVRPDAAILDVRVKDGEVFPLARELQKLGTHIVFHSGHAEPEALYRDFPEAGFCPKPTRADQLEKSLRSLIEA
ncbi:response regulator [Albibacillus kandeliae]|uniref:response regulator n=1 Tax=Albibacillus kandeliae TaxID=2174228 RepID=UPI000D6962B4|nr:response regulator [Albibacillus kandeliae]